MPIKTIFITLAIIFQLAGFVPYYINICKKTARPHLFSWTTWGILPGLGFVLSYSKGGGEGSWVFAMEMALCLGIAVYALFKGEKNIKHIDWITFISAVIIIIFYIFTRNAVLSVVLAATIDFIGYFPTIRKSYLKPHDEPALGYFLAFLSFLFSVGALQAYNFVTLFYPLTLIATNGIFTSFLLIRRRLIGLVESRI